MLHFIGFCCFIALGSVATFHWVWLIHFIGFCCYIAVGSGGSLRDWDPWVQGGLTIPICICIEGRSGVGSTSYTQILFIILAGQNSDNLWVTPTPTHSLSSFHLPLFVVIFIGPGMGPSLATAGNSAVDGGYFVASDTERTQRVLEVVGRLQSAPLSCSLLLSPS